jgi:hypothetical protein
MFVAMRASVPTTDLLNISRMHLMHSEEKPSMAAVVEIITEHFWRVRAMPGQLHYSREVADLLRAHHIDLPFEASGKI